ncbi:uncharacterized protein THITE_23050, partial [Thermothielavioides terrestris NRRL 8126]
GDQSGRGMRKRPRQNPGPACQQCRLRKLRCDRQTPCNGCLDAGVECNVDPTPPQRGPKKGHLKALRSRIGRPSRPPGTQRESTCFLHGGSPLEHQADTWDRKRDQLYFDRIHAFVPAIHHRRYLQRSRVALPTPSHRCLQYAMWTMASAMSSQFHHLRDSLYRGTLDLLHALDDARPTTAGTAATTDNDDEASLLAQAQAWILVAVYEFVQLPSSFRRAWASVGRAIRLVQLLRLSEMDAGDDHDAAVLDFTTPYNGDTDVDVCIEREERRRTFWVAFCLDRFASALSGLPLTLGELISTRLPCPEPAFQSATSVVMPLLSEIMETTDMDAEPRALSAPSSPWVECIVFCTLWGRALSHQQRSKLEHFHGPVAVAFRERQVRLDELLTSRMRLFQQRYAPGAVKSDPMLLFTNLVAQATVLSLCK